MGIKDYILSPKQKAEINEKRKESFEKDKEDAKRRKQLDIILAALPFYDKNAVFTEKVEQALYEFGYPEDEEEVKSTDYNKNYILRITDIDIKILKYLNKGIIENKYDENTIRSKKANFIIDIEKELLKKSQKKRILMI